MRKIGIIAVLSLMALALAAVPALAQNPHFGQGARAAVITDLGQQLQVTGTIVGLGQEPLEVTVTAVATAVTFCHNPGNPEHIVPGQTQEGVLVEAGTGEVTPDRQGRFVINTGALVTDVPTVTPEAAGCPNPDKWTATVGDVSFSDVRIFVEQPLGTEPVEIAFFPGPVASG